MIVRAKQSPSPLIPKVYVLQINKDPILAFEAHSLNEARELAKEPWLRSELSGLRSGGRKVWDGQATLQVGPAVGEQLETVRTRLSALRSTAEVPIVYLIVVDR